MARGDLNEGRIPTFRGVRVALGTGCNRVEGHRRAWRNGRVCSSPHPKSLTLRFATVSSLLVLTARTPSSVAQAMGGFVLTFMPLGIPPLLPHFLRTPFIGLVGFGAGISLPGAPQMLPAASPCVRGQP